MLPNDIVVLQDTTLCCEHQLEVSPFPPPRPHDYIRPSCSYNFLLDYGDSSHPHPFNQMPFEGMSYPSLRSLMTTIHLDTRDALGVIWFLIMRLLYQPSHVRMMRVIN